MDLTVCGTLVSLNSRHRVLQDRLSCQNTFQKDQTFPIYSSLAWKESKMDYKISWCTLCLPQNNLLGIIEYSATSQSFDYLESGLCLGK